MRTFAKLFDSPRFGQIAVLRQEGDDGDPEVRCFTEPPDHGVCSIAVGWEDTDAGYENREACFDRCDITQAEAWASDVFKMLGVQSTGSDHG